MRTGWSQTARTGETDDEAQARLDATYPGTTAVRKFFQSTSLGSGSAPDLMRLTAGSRLVLSFPYASTMPSIAPFADPLLDRGVDVGVVVAHEPEKKITPSQLLSANQALDSQTQNHPHRGTRLTLGAIVTVQRARIYQPSDLRLFFTPQLAQHIDFLGWDWYPSSAPKGQMTAYEDPALAGELMRDYSAELGLPWEIDEINHSAINLANGFGADTDPNDTMAPVWYGDFHAWCELNGCQSWHQFHKGGGDFTRTDNPEHTPSPRTAMADKLRELIAEGSLNNQPDPGHPQYQFGYEAGHGSGTTYGRDTELDALEAYLADRRAL